MRKYDKCGVDFSEQEYKGVEVINQVEQKTVEKNIYFYYHYLFLLDLYPLFCIYMRRYLFDFNDSNFS